ncbi:MAG: hypothetical protein AB7S26_15115 [Sandaracinaceae bacterium]
MSRSDAALADAMADAGAPYDAGRGVGSGSFVLSGVYFVPERSDVSTYDVADVEWDFDGDRASLSYDLPRFLVGRDERVDFSGTLSADGSIATLAGDNGTASCTLDANRIPVACREDFDAMPIDENEIRRIATDLDPMHVEERVGVSVAFSTDPIGVLEPHDARPRR